MTERQLFAYERPLSRAIGGGIEGFRRIRRVEGGVLVSILTVNR